MNSLHLCIDHNEMTSSICKELESGNSFLSQLIDSSFEKQFRKCIEEQFGERLIRPPKVEISVGWIRSLKHLTKTEAYGVVEIVVSVPNDDNLKIKEIIIEGFIPSHVESPSDLLTRCYKIKKWKKWTNHKVRFWGEIPGMLFEKAFNEVQSSRIPQPYQVELSGSHEYGWSCEYDLATFHHVVTGDIIFCNCHKEAHKQILEEVEDQIANPPSPGTDSLSSWRRPRLVKLLSQGRYQDGVCHFCLVENHSIEHSHLQYGTDVKSSYAAYVNILMRQDGLDRKTALREVKRRLGISRWIREDQLYDLVHKLFKSAKILRESSPEWLRGLRFDIYLPEYNLAIEHQGQQHYEPVDFWGGKEGFKNTVRRDNLKRKRCKENGVSLVEVRYDQTLTEASLRHRLNRWLKLKENIEEA